MTNIHLSDAAKTRILSERNHRLGLLGRAKPRLLYASEVTMMLEDGRIAHYGPELSLSFFEGTGYREHEWLTFDLGENCTVAVGPLGGFVAEENYIDWDDIEKKFTVRDYLSDEQV